MTIPFGLVHAADNPLLKESTLPFQFPPFDKIKNDDFQPAIEQGMKEQLQEVDKIASQKEKPTFENTIVAMEKSGRLLARANRTFSNLNACNTNPEMQKIDKELSPKLAAHQDAIRLNGPLFARIQALYDQRDQLKLDAESKYLLERYYKDFVRAGAKLNDADKAKLKEMNQEIAKAQTTFEQNVLKEKNADSVVVDTREELDGLTNAEIDAAAKAAKEEGKEGKFAIRLQNTTDQPPLKNLKNRALRQRLMEASLARNSHGGEFDNKEVVSKIAKLRAERAVLLGYPNHAAYQLEDQTAKDVPTVNKLLADITPAAVANAKKEIADMQAVIDQQGGGFQLEPWDWDFYAEQVRKAKYDFDEVAAASLLRTESRHYRRRFLRGQQGVRHHLQGTQRPSDLSAGRARLGSVQRGRIAPRHLHRRLLRAAFEARRRLGECLCCTEPLVRHANGHRESSQHPQAAGRSADFADGR